MQRGGREGVQTDCPHPEKNIKSVLQRHFQGSFFGLLILGSKKNSQSAAETGRHNQKCGPLTPPLPPHLTKMP